MQKIIHRAEDRGSGDYGWLQTRYSFSFADWHDPSRMGFGALRVLNDDTIAPGSGFPTHGHRDMEIITIVTSGMLTHKDSLGNEGTVQEGEVQVMSAGAGIIHSEYNTSRKSPLSLFQIWIETARPSMPPRYAQKKFPASAQDTLEFLVGPEGAADLWIAQDAFIARASLSAGSNLSYACKRSGHGLYAFIAEGSATIAGETLAERDAVGITGSTGADISAERNAVVLLIEVPIR